VIPSNKNGDKMKLDNYRGIALMNVVANVFRGGFLRKDSRGAGRF
jgi:hypothetical protein